MQDCDAENVSESGLDNLDQPVITEFVQPGDVHRGLVDVESIVVAAFDTYASRLKAFALRSVRDADVADDLVQDAFSRLLVEVDSKRLPEDVGAWLFTVCGNLLVSRGRREAVALRMKSRLFDRRSPASPANRGPRRRERPSHGLPRRDAARCASRAPHVSSRLLVGGDRSGHRTN